MGDRPKQMSCQPRRFVEEFCQPREKKVEKVGQKCKTDRNLYDVEVVEVDTTRKQLKTHFVGFSHEYDEWCDYDNERDYFPFVRLEKIFFPEEGLLVDRGNIFHGQLYRCIKRKLWSGRRDDPEVRIELNVEPDVFALALGQVTKSFLQRGKEIYHVKDNRSLDSVLGLKWDERIMNYSGDFAYVVEDTVRFWMSKRAAIEEFKYIGGKLVKCEIEDSFFFVFTFVRGDGNRRQYQEMP